MGFWVIDSEDHVMFGGTLVKLLGKLLASSFLALLPNGNINEVLSVARAASSFEMDSSLPSVTREKDGLISMLWPRKERLDV